MHVYTFLILSTVFVCESSSWSGGVSLSPCPGRSTAITWWSCDKFWKWRKLFIIKKYKKYSITMVYKWTSIWKWKIILTSCKKTRNSIMYNYNWWSYWPIKNWHTGICNSNYSSVQKSRNSSTVQLVKAHWTKRRSSKIQFMDTLLVCFVCDRRYT